MIARSVFPGKHFGLSIFSVELRQQPFSLTTFSHGQPGESSSGSLLFLHQATKPSQIFKIGGRRESDIFSLFRVLSAQWLRQCYYWWLFFCNPCGIALALLPTTTASILNYILLRTRCHVKRRRIECRPNQTKKSGRRRTEKSSLFSCLPGQRKSPL